MKFDGMKFDGMTTARRAEGLIKRYGGFDALGHLDPEVAMAGGAWARQRRDPAGE